MVQITTIGLLAQSASHATQAGQAGKKAAVLMATAIVWNGRFAPVLGQQVLAKGQLVASIKAALTKNGAKVRSVEAWTSHGQRMALSHGAEIERAMNGYINDETRNSDPTMAGAVKAILAWAAVEFPTLETMVEQTDTRVAKTDAQKTAAKLASLCSAVNALKDPVVLRRLADLAQLKADVLGARGNLSAETLAYTHTQIAALVASFKPEEDTEIEEEVTLTTAGMLQEAEAVANAA